MIKVSKISVQEKNKERCNIYCNDEYFCSFSMELVYLNRIKVGQEYTEAQFEAFKIEDERKYGFNLALKYISKTIKTKREVKDYLLKKDISINSINLIIEKLISYNYLDDKDYVRRYIESCPKSYGDRLIDSKLIQKGISKEIIQSVRENLENNSQERANELVKKRLKNKELTMEEIAKTYRYVLSKGFSYDEAERAISKYKEDL